MMSIHWIVDAIHILAFLWVLPAAWASKSMLGIHCAVISCGEVCFSGRVFSFVGIDIAL